MIGLIIIMVLPFIYFYTQMNKLNNKTSAIKKAMDEGKETYIDPIDYKMHWTENGALVMKQKLNSLLRPGDRGAIAGDEVIIDLNTHKIYKNYSKEEFEMHIQKQINNNEVWCAERKHYRDGGWYNDSGMKYHMKDKYFYRLESKVIWTDHVKQHPNDTGYKDGTVYCYKQLFNSSTNNYYRDKNEITYDEYIKLGGNKIQPDFIIRHMR